LIPNGVDLAQFYPAKGEEPREPRVVYVGRLSKEKNLGALLRAAILLRGHLAVRLVLVGEGPQRASLAAEARAAGRRRALPGVVDHARLPGWLHRAGVFALPSFTEGHPK